MNFPVGPGISIVSNPMFKDRCIGIYTEDHGKPIVNHCNKCVRSYYDVQSLVGTSALSSTVKLTQCPHSNKIRGYIMVL
jgi:hypothetical protein